jgi:hypothetical protein
MGSGYEVRGVFLTIVIPAYKKNIYLFYRFITAGILSFYPMSIKSGIFAFLATQ